MEVMKSAIQLTVLRGGKETPPVANLDSRHFYSP